MYKVYVKYGGMEYPLHEPLVMMCESWIRC